MAQKANHIGGPSKVNVGETLLDYIERGYGAEFVLDHADKLVKPSERRNVTGLLRTVLKTWQHEVQHMESAPCEPADTIANALSKVTRLEKLIAHLESSLSKTRGVPQDAARLDAQVQGASGSE